jgi:hypothetical protein
MILFIYYKKRTARKERCISINRQRQLSLEPESIQRAHMYSVRQMAVNMDM